jgi:hypothetical protein
MQETKCLFHLIKRILEALEIPSSKPGSVLALYPAIHNLHLTRSISIFNGPFRVCIPVYIPF